MVATTVDDNNASSFSKKLVWLKSHCRQLLKNWKSFIDASTWVDFWNFPLVIVTRPFCLNLVELKKGTMLGQLKGTIFKSLNVDRPDFNELLEDLKHSCKKCLKRTFQDLDENSEKNFIKTGKNCIFLIILC